MSSADQVIANPKTCGDVLAMCVCELATGHPEDHACECGGSWDADGEPVGFPMGFTLEEGIALLFGDENG